MPKVEAKVQTTKLEAKVKIVEEKEKGEVIDRELVTTVTLEYDGTPAKLDDVLYTLRAGHAVDVTFSSPQMSLDLPQKSKEPAEVAT
jgi:putative NADH-flavin reductase